MGRDDPSRPVRSRPVPSLCHGTHIGVDRGPGRHSLLSERPRVYLLVREKHSTRCHGLGTLRRMPPGQEPVLPQQNSESSVSSSSSCCSDPVSVAEQDKTFHGLPELLDKCWWIKSFFHCEPSPPTVGRKALSASSTNS
ncbi:pancreatic progenitor cell differentiation and proliferation factor-like protein isoform X1 [Tympanuchus pallidicinctus]|uniref:pancreatic progenitor cell differentiation and proliferation factor-like protein isoform X1 n=1 Tax=Tympanuchus pallidicinctus TaxID=109042 RepID=UPI00228731AE|nr:pancreatic progenitor cell differentiation and proliferation factor-like protein isoform X1 [Tympanuchus pallidicinctus]